MDRKDFTVKIEDKEVEVCVLSPNAKDKKEASKIYNTAFTEALKSGAVVRAKLDDILVEQGLWNEAKQIKFDTIQRELSECETKLEKGGIPLATAKEIALKMKRLRAEFREVISDKTSLDTHSAEGQADSERFNYLVYACTYHSDGKRRYYNSYQEYMDKGDDPVSVAAATHLANMLYNLEADYEKKLPENKFLRDYKFVNDDLRLINKKGQLVDIEGRLINEEGHFIDEEGNLIDKYGNRVDEEGNLEVDFVPFTDDEGNPVLLEEEGNEEKPKAAKKSTKKEASSKKTE